MVCRPGLSPLHYSICLHLSPEDTVFTGQETVSLEALHPVREVFLNAQGLRIESASILAEGEEWTVTVKWAFRHSSSRLDACSNRESSSFVSRGRVGCRR